MKKLLVLSALTLFMLTLAPLDSKAAKLRHNAGCGLGTKLFEGKGSESVFLTVTFAVTLNHVLSANQLFGISSGTLDCKQPKTMTSTETFHFVAMNMDNLAKDIAMGQGESIETLAELMGVSSDKKIEFMTTLQSSFSSIYTHDGVEPGEVIDNIHAVIG